MEFPIYAGIFKFRNARFLLYQKQLTSNKYFGDWGELMNDTVIATAILDRLLHHSHIINIRGESYRLKDRLKGGVRVVPPADISVKGNSKNA